MGYLYTAVWIILAGYILYIAVRRYKTPILYILAGFMTFLGVWEFVNTLTEVDIKTGVYGWIYRGVAALALIACLIWYFGNRKER